VWSRGDDQLDWWWLESREVPGACHEARDGDGDANGKNHTDTFT